MCHYNAVAYADEGKLYNINTVNKNEFVLTETRLQRISNSSNGLCVHFQNSIPEKVQKAPTAKFKNKIVKGRL